MLLVRTLKTYLELMGFNLGGTLSSVWMLAGMNLSHLQGHGVGL
jgi:hypothetical protein